MGHGVMVAWHGVVELQNLIVACKRNDRRQHGLVLNLVVSDVRLFPSLLVSCVHCATFLRSILSYTVPK